MTHLKTKPLNESFYFDLYCLSNKTCFFRRLVPLPAIPWCSRANKQKKEEDEEETSEKKGEKKLQE